MITFSKKRDTSTRKNEAVNDGHSTNPRLTHYTKARSDGKGKASIKVEKSEKKPRGGMFAKMETKLSLLRCFGL
jgi:hypothetical protein